MEPCRLDTWTPVLSASTSALETLTRQTDSLKLTESVSSWLPKNFEQGGAVLQPVNKGLILCALLEHMGQRTAGGGLLPRVLSHFHTSWLQQRRVRLVKPEHASKVLPNLEASLQQAFWSTHGCHLDCSTGYPVQGTQWPSTFGVHRPSTPKLWHWEWTPT